MGLEKIEIFRKDKGITQKELSELSGVPLGTLTKIIIGETTDPKLETIKAIAKALGKTLDDLDDDLSGPAYNKPPALPSIGGIDENGNYVAEFSDEEKLRIIKDMANLPDEALSDLKVLFEFMDAKYNRK